jgi:putative phage-type endonuclease
MSTLNACDDPSASDSLCRPPQRIALGKRRNSIRLANNNVESVLHQVVDISATKKVRRTKERPDLEQSAVDRTILANDTTRVVYRQQQCSADQPDRFDPPMPLSVAAALPAFVQTMLKQRFVEQGGAAWHADRERGITASMAAHAVHAGFIGFTAHKRFPASEIALLERAGIVKSDRDDDETQASNTGHGHKWESSALLHCAVAERCDAICVGLLTHPQYRWLGASPDGVLLDGRLVEIKVPKSRPVKPGNPIPPYYWIQTQIQMAVCGANECIYYEFRPPSARISEIRTNVMRVRRNKEWFAFALPLFQCYLEHTVRMQRIAALFATI